MSLETTADLAHEKELRRAADAFGDRYEYDAKAAEIAATRGAVAAIKAIPVWAKTEAAYAHLCAVILSEIKNSGWGHTNAAENAMQYLADAADTLEEAK